MKPLPHQYDVHLAGGPNGYAHLTATGGLDLTTAPPLDFDGPGDAWSPEHLLVASVQSCLLFTLRAVARASKLEFTDFEVDALGTVNRTEGVTRFTDIGLRARLTVPPGTDLERARHVLDKAHRACLVSASMSTPIRLVSEVVER